MYISLDRTVGRPQLGCKGDMTCRGVLEVVFKISEMHIPPWYRFRLDSGSHAGGDSSAAGVRLQGDGHGMSAGKPGLSVGEVAHIVGAARAKGRRSQASHRHLYSEQLCTPHLLTIGNRYIISGYRCEHPDLCVCCVTPGSPEIRGPRFAVERRFGPGVGFCYLNPVS